MSSWLDRIKNDIVIKTGDGISYIPTWINAKKQLEYNVASFDFPNVEGTLVKRSKPLGRKFELEIFFQGEFHLDDASNFEFSAKNTNPWTITHPYYDTIIVQPTSLLFDNSQHNITKITGTLLETITDNNPIARITPVDQIKLLKENLDPTFTGSLTATPKSSDISDISAKNTKNYNLSIPIIKIPSEVENYRNLFNQAESFVNTATATPLLFMRTTVALITEPAKFSIDVQTRLNLFQSQFNNLRSTLNSGSNPSTKQIYQNTAGTAISSMCYCYVFPFAGEITNGRLVLSQMDFIIKNYNQYLQDLDFLQSANGGNTTSFIPDPNSLIGLNNLVNTTIANLYQIALSSKQERIIQLENDTNLINLTHILYGLDDLDANIDTLFQQNNWGLNQILEIKKGTEVVYYI